MAPHRALVRGEGQRSAHGYVYQLTGRELWVRSVGKARRHFAGEHPTAKADAVRGDKVRRVEIYAHNIRSPRWQLVAGRTAPPLARGPRRRVERQQLTMEM